MNIQESLSSFESWFLQQIGLGLVAGFLVGFMIKHYLKYLLLITVGCSLLLYAAQYYALITINPITINYETIHGIVNWWPILLDIIKVLLYNYYSFIAAGMIGFVFALLFG